MADVFISYKREEIAHAERVAVSLAEEGFTAFFDAHQEDGIQIGEAWDTRLERELGEAKAVIVLWSPASVLSANVRDEARRAHARGILFPARIAACEPPLGLGVVQTANLIGWGGDRRHLQWRQLIDNGVARKLGRRALAPPPPAPAPIPTTRMVIQAPPRPPQSTPGPTSANPGSANPGRANYVPSTRPPTSAPAAKAGGSQYMCQVCHRLSPTSQPNCVHCGAPRGNDLIWKIALIAAVTIIPTIIYLAAQ